MKNKFLHVCCVLTSMIAISCGNEQNSTHQRTNTLPIKDAQFTLSEETFGSDVEITRASQPVSKDTAKISDALEAEVSVERDTKTPLTRATIEMSNQHYTIYATQNGQLVANSMIKGTVSGSGSNKKFVPDAGTTSKVQLPAGTYTFVCFNDALAMQPSGELKLADTPEGHHGESFIGHKNANYLRQEMASGVHYGTLLCPGARSAENLLENQQSSSKFKCKQHRCQPASNDLQRRWFGCTPHR